MNLPSYISIQAVIMLILFGTSVSYLLGRRKTNRPFLMALVGGVLAVMPPLFVIYLVLLLLKKDLSSATATADLDEPKP
jgi:ABC-type molybdate transport system permease subunit